MDMKTGAIIPPLIALFFVVLTGCSTPKVVGDATSAPVALPPLAKRQVSYRVAPLGQTDLVFIGQPRSSDARSTPSGMAYPGGDPFSFLAAITVHAAIQGSVTSAAEQAQIEAANKVLLECEQPQRSQDVHHYAKRKGRFSSRDSSSRAA